jgi:hypothetical protein
MTLLAAVVIGCSSHSLGYAFDEPRGARLEADGITALEIHATAGSLRVVGGAELAEVLVEGTARAYHAEELEQIDMQLDRVDDRLVLRASVPSNPRGQVALDLDVRLPAGLAVTIEDSSGSIDCRSVGALTVKDGSGSIDVEHVNGGVTIHDGSGSIDVMHVSGEVVIHDGSGSLEVEHVAGPVRIEADGSGSITITHVAGDVFVRNGSGSINVHHVAGAFTVESNGSGRIEFGDIAGAVSVPPED